MTHQNFKKPVTNSGARSRVCSHRKVKHSSPSSHYFLQIPEVIHTSQVDESFKAVTIRLIGYYVNPCILTHLQNNLIMKMNEHQNTELRSIDNGRRKANHFPIVPPLRNLGIFSSSVACSSVF